MQIFYPIIHGGGEYIFYLISTDLAKRGHDVSIITNRYKGTTSFENIEGVKIYRVGNEREYLGQGDTTIKHNLQYIVLASKKGIELIRESKRKSKKIEVIHSNTYIPTFPGQICSSIFKIPHIVTFHDVHQASNKKFWSEWISKLNPNLPFYTATVSKIIEKLVLKLPVHTFHTVSEDSKDDLLAFHINKNKIKVIENGIRLSDYLDESDSIKNNTNEQSVIYIGRLVFYKNIETVIKAFKIVLKVFPNTKLVIVGEGPSKNDLIEEAADIKDNVIFTGKINDQEKVKRLRLSSFMVLPSIYESFGIVIIEGFVCKKPVLVSNVRTPSDIVKDGYSGYVIPPYDISAWADRIISLLKNKDKQKEMGENAYKEFLSRYQIETVASKMELLYKDAISSSKK